MGVQHQSGSGNGQVIYIIAMKDDECCTNNAQKRQKIHKAVALTFEKKKKSSIRQEVLRTQGET